MLSSYFGTNLQTTFVSVSSSEELTVPSAQYMAFDTVPTTASQKAVDSDDNLKKTYHFGELAPGSHTFLIGSIDDGNYYTHPWCSIEIDWGAPTTHMPAPPGHTALPLGHNVGIGEP